MSVTHKPVLFGLSLDLLIKLGGLVLAAAAYTGVLEYRVQQLEKHEAYYHGEFVAPRPAAK